MSRARSLSMFLAIGTVTTAIACGGAKSPESTSAAEPASQDATEAAPAAEEAPASAAQPDANAGGAPSGEAPAEPTP